MKKKDTDFSVVFKCGLLNPASSKMRSSKYQAFRCTSGPMEKLLLLARNLCCFVQMLDGEDFSENWCGGLTKTKQKVIPWWVRSCRGSSQAWEPPLHRNGLAAGAALQRESGTGKT